LKTIPPPEILDQEPASRIKPLDRTELGHVALSSDRGPMPARPPISLMGCECLGAAQARITRGLRESSRAGASPTSSTATAPSSTMTAGGATARRALTSPGSSMRRPT
jgi:hypothetical protein